MSKTKVFISFDYDNDESQKVLLVGQSKHSDSPFELADWSIKEPIDTNWKAKAKTRISSVDVVAVICGAQTPTASGVTAELNIAQELGKPYFLLCGYSSKTCVKPVGAKPGDKMYDWTWENLKLLIGGSR